MGLGLRVWFGFGALGYPKETLGFLLFGMAVVGHGRGDSGKENGSYYCVLGFYRDNEKRMETTTV